MYAEMPPCSGDIKSDWRQLLDSWRAGHKVHVDDLQELVFRGGLEVRVRGQRWVRSSSEVGGRRSEWA